MYFVGASRVTATYKYRDLDGTVKTRTKTLSQDRVAYWFKLVQGLGYQTVSMTISCSQGTVNYIDRSTLTD